MILPTRCPLPTLLLAIGLLSVAAQAASPCASPLEGRGQADPGFVAALEALVVQDPAGFDAGLEALRPQARSEYEQALLQVADGMMLSRRGQADRARTLLEPQLDNPYLARAMRDGIRTELARLAVAERAYARANSLLDPVLSLNCAPLPIEAYYLAADARMQTGRAEDALWALDRAPGTAKVDTDWWRAVRVELSCKVEGAGRCVERALDLAREGGLDPGLADVLNTLIGRASTDPAAQAALDAGRQQGLIDADHRLLDRAALRIEALTPLTRITPRYPHAAAREQLSGFVNLEILVGADGNVIEARVVDSSPPGVFDAEALRAARKGRFQPRLKDGIAVETRGSYTVRFLIGP